MKVLHIITGLSHGGAERQLINLCQSKDFESLIFSIRPISDNYNSKLKDSRVECISGDAGTIFSFSWVINLIRLIRVSKPDIVVGWMYHGNLAAIFSKLFSFKTPVIWNFRHSISDLKNEKFFTRQIIILLKYFQPIIEVSIYNSSVSRDQHINLGFSRKNNVIIYNGIDTDLFLISKCSGLDFRSQHGISKSKILVGVLSRNHKMKNIHGFMKDFASIKNEFKNIQCIIAGKDINNEFTTNLKEALSLTDEDLILLPEIKNPELFYPALDFFVLPSLWGEGFPNVIAEAMSCGITPIARNIGEISYLIGPCGYIIERDFRSELVNILKNDKSKFGELQVRSRIVDLFGIQKMISAYNKLFNQVLKTHN